MRYELKSIGLWALIKVSFFFNLVVGFLFGLFYAVFAGFMMTILSRLSQFQPELFDLAPMETLPIGIMLVVMPIMFAVLGAIFYTIICVILAVIYNLIAKIVGGYELVLEPVPGIAESPAGGPPLTGYTGAPTYVAPAPPGPTPQSTPPSAPQAPPLPPEGPPGSSGDQEGEEKTE